MKTKNFPEKKRQRQLNALARMTPATKGKEGKPSVSNADVIAFLKQATSASRRDVRTKKDRSGTGRMFRAA